MGIAILLAALALVVWVVTLFNGLIRLRNTSNNAWSDVDVHLKKRHDLVPNLVETVKGYAKHEKETLERVVLARNQAVSATSTLAKSTTPERRRHRNPFRWGGGSSGFGSSGGSGGGFGGGGGGSW